MTKLYGLSQEIAMRSVNVHEAKTHLSRLINAAANGEPFIHCPRPESRLSR